MNKKALTISRAFPELRELEDLSAPTIDDATLYLSIELPYEPPEDEEIEEEEDLIDPEDIPLSVELYRRDRRITLSNLRKYMSGNPENIYDPVFPTDSVPVIRDYEEDDRGCTTLSNISNFVRGDMDREVLTEENTIDPESRLPIQKFWSVTLGVRENNPLTVTYETVDKTDEEGNLIGDPPETISVPVSPDPYPGISRSYTVEDFWHYLRRISDNQFRSVAVGWNPPWLWRYKTRSRPTVEHPVQIEVDTDEVTGQPIYETEMVETEWGEWSENWTQVELKNGISDQIPNTPLLEYMYEELPDSEFERNCFIDEDGSMWTKSTLTVEDDTFLNKNLTVLNSVEIKDHLTVLKTGDIGSNFTIGGNLVVRGTINVTGNFSGSANYDLTGDVTIGRSLTAGTTIQTGGNVSIPVESSFRATNGAWEFNQNIHDRLRAIARRVGIHDTGWGSPADSSGVITERSFMTRLASLESRTSSLETRANNLESRVGNIERYLTNLGNTNHQVTNPVGGNSYVNLPAFS